MPSEEITAMNLIYSIEFRVKQAILEEKPIDELKPTYFEAQKNYLLVQHKLFPEYYEVACTPEEADNITLYSWKTLIEDMEELKKIRKETH